METDASHRRKKKLLGNPVSSITRFPRNSLLEATGKDPLGACGGGAEERAV